jgi:hypothetical protein
LQEHQKHIYQGEPDEDLIEALEPDQLFAAVHQPLPRKQLSPAVNISLWGLRIFLIAVAAAVVYAFVVGVIHGAG